MHDEFPISSNLSSLVFLRSAILRVGLSYGKGERAFVPDLRTEN